MYSPIALIAVFAALAAAAPTKVVDRASRVQCNDNAISAPPAAPTTLPAPPAGTKNILVALGKGTQNYTCASPSSTPTANGALATLYDASCMAVRNPDGLVSLTHSCKDRDGAPGGLSPIGKHYFVDATTPTFVLQGIGATELKKNASSNAPSNTVGDVPWLYLTAQAQGTNTKVKAVYRVVTSGGSAPASCGDHAAGSSFTVNYAANYYFYSL